MLIWIICWIRPSFFRRNCEVSMFYRVVIKFKGLVECLKLLI